MSEVRPDGRDRIGSIPHVRRTLSAALADAVKRGLIARNPVALARTPKHRKPAIAPYSLGQVRTLLNVAERCRQPARWLIAAVVGLRQGEVLGLKWDDIDADAGTLTVSRQLQRLVWQHGCGDAPCGRKRGTDCPQRHSGGLVTSEPKSDAGTRVISWRRPSSMRCSLTASDRPPSDSQPSTGPTADGCSRTSTDGRWLHDATSASGGNSAPTPECQCDGFTICATPPRRCYSKRTSTSSRPARCSATARSARPTPTPTSSPTAKPPPLPSWKLTSLEIRPDRRAERGWTRGRVCRGQQRARVPDRQSRGTRPGMGTPR